MRRSIAALIGLGILAVAAPASANPTEVRVPVTSADLESPEAILSLYQRVNEAAASVCAEIMQGDHPAYRSRRQCRIALVDQALATSTVEPLTRFHAAVRSGRTATTLASR
ncbi:MAG: UrcA family protein [Terricaulis sp.]